MQPNPFFLLFITLLFPFLLTAQVRHTVSGTVRDQTSGETLIGASIQLVEQPRSAVLSNAYGFYSIAAIPGHYRLIVSFAGYKSDTMVITMEKDTVIPIALNPAGPQLQEVVVTANKNDNNVSRPLMGVQKLSVSEIKDLPVLFGEKDI